MLWFSSKEKARLNVSRALDGGACVNQRSLRLALDLFKPETAAAGPPLTPADLLEALWVLELAIVARNLTYDGTLPKREVDALGDDSASLFGACGFPASFVGAVRPSTPADQKAFASTAAMKALDDLGFLKAAGGGAGFAPQAGLDQPLAEADALAFFERLAVLRREAGAGGVSDDQIESLLDDASRFRGSKCIAGLALLGAEALDRALDVPKTYDVPVPLAAAVLINRFRFTYIRTLAYSVRDEYVPANRWRPLSQYHSITFADVVRKSLAQRFTRDLERQLGGADSQFTVALPPIGLYALLTSPETAGPRGVLAHARDIFSDYGAAFRKFWSYTREVKPPKEGWTARTGDPHLDRDSERIERTLTNRLGKLKRVAQRGYGCTLDRITTPIVSAGSAAAGALLGGALGGGFGVVGGAALGAAIGDSLKEFYGVARQGIRAHADDYRRLDDDLFRVYAAGLKLEAVEERVARVFGRKLTQPTA